MISLANRFLFVHIPKTGGNSVQDALRAYADDEIITPHKHQDGIERFELSNKSYGTKKHATFAEYSLAVGREELASLFKFSTIRNPWDRMVSFYFSPHRGSIKWDREGFIQLVREQPIARTYLCTDADKAEPLDCNFDLIMKFESLEDDFFDAARQLSIDTYTLPRRNVSTHQHYSYYYDDEIKDLVSAKFSEEIDFWNYEFEAD
ncbi:MAG: sulfotransferase family 2 domain-containing protein [Pseudomonadota bacterium]